MPNRLLRFWLALYIAFVGCIFFGLGSILERVPWRKAEADR